MRMIKQTMNEKAAWSQTGSQIRNHCCKPKSRLAALCHKPALLHIKQIGTH